MTRTKPAVINLGYGLQLLEAGMKGLHTSGGGNVPAGTQLASSFRTSLKAAALGAGVAWLGSSLIGRRGARVQATLTCSALVFCAELGWQTRSLSSYMMRCAAKEMSKVRDQHWLELNPIDYA